MSSTSANGTDDYVLVSSFYGPRATGGWFLTALASLLSYGLHPKIHNVDSVSTDFIAVLTFPTVAAAHLISQVRSFPSDARDANDMEMVQKVASMEAPLNVTTLFLAMSVISFFLILKMKCIKRGCLVAAVALICLSAHFYLHTSQPVLRTLGRKIGKIILIRSGSLMSSVEVFVSVYMLFAVSQKILFYVKPNWVQVDDQDATMARPGFWQIWHEKGLIAFPLLFAFYPTLVQECIRPLFDKASPIYKDMPSQSLPWLGGVASRIAYGFIPRSNASIRELDQAVALLAGATVLGFSLYSVTSSRYRARLFEPRTS